MRPGGGGGERGHICTFHQPNHHVRNSLPGPHDSFNVAAGERQEERGVRGGAADTSSARQVASSRLVALSRLASWSIAHSHQSPSTVWFWFLFPHGLGSDLGYRSHGACGNLCSIQWFSCHTPEIYASARCWRQAGIEQQGNPHDQHSITRLPCSSMQQHILWFVNQHLSINENLSYCMHPFQVGSQPPTSILPQRTHYLLLFNSHVSQE